MEPIRNLKDYFEYNSILKDVDSLIQYYKKYHDDVHHGDPGVQRAKRKLLKTKYQTLDGQGGKKVSIEHASDQQVNATFRDSFSRKGLSMPEYLKTITKPWYESRIKKYEGKIRDVLPTATINDLIVAEHLAKKDSDPERAENLHQTIEQKLGSYSPRELKELWNSYVPNVHALLQYDAFQKLI